MFKDMFYVNVIKKTLNDTEVLKLTNLLAATGIDG